MLKLWTATVLLALGTATAAMPETVFKDETREVLPDGTTVSTSLYRDTEVDKKNEWNKATSVIGPWVEVPDAEWNAQGYTVLESYRSYTVETANKNGKTKGGGKNVQRFEEGVSRSYVPNN